MPIVISAFGDESAELAARIGDGLWLSSLNSDTIQAFKKRAQSPIFRSSPCVGVPTATRQSRWPTGVAKHRPSRQLNQELRTILDFEQAVELVTPSSSARRCLAGQTRNR